MALTILNDIIDGFKKAFTFAGRATRRQYWTFCIFAWLMALILGVVLALIQEVLAWLLVLVLLVPQISIAVRRLHDVNLSGFWMWYLSSMGLPIVYMAYLLDLDPACGKMVERIRSTGSAWLGWILAFLFWSAGAPLALALIFLYAGKKEDNEFGPNPYAE